MSEPPQVTVEATVIQTGGRAVFSYRLTNTGSAALGEFALAIAAGTGLRAPCAPPGWLALYLPAEGRLVWQSAARATDLATGEALDGFRFQAAACAGPASYRVRHFAADGHTACRGGGVTQAPVAPPASCPGQARPARRRKCIVFVRITHRNSAPYYNCHRNATEEAGDADPPPRL